MHKKEKSLGVKKKFFFFRVILIEASTHKGPYFFSPKVVEVSKAQYSPSAIVQSSSLTQMANPPQTCKQSAKVK